MYDNADELKKSSSVNPATHVQAASKNNDDEYGATIIVSAVSFGITFFIYLYLEWNLMFTSMQTIDEIVMVFAFSFAWPWLWLAYTKLKVPGRAARRADTLLHAFEDAVGMDLNRDGFVGPSYPDHWLAEYVSAMITSSLTTTREAAMEYGLTQTQWEVARDTLIQVGIAIPKNYSDGRRGFRLKQLTLIELNNRMPREAPPLYEKRRKEPVRQNLISHSLARLVSQEFIDDYDGDDDYWEM